MSNNIASIRIRKLINPNTTAGNPIPSQIECRLVLAKHACWCIALI